MTKNKTKATKTLSGKKTKQSNNQGLTEKLLKNPVLTKTKKSDAASLDIKLPKKRIGGASFVGGGDDLWRFAIVWGVMVICFVILFGRAYYLQIKNSEFLIEKGDEFITAKRNTPVSRGMISDTFGVPLAANAPLSTVVFSPYDYAQKYYQAKRRLISAKSDKTQQNAKKTMESLDLARLAQAANFPLERLQQAVAIDDSVDVKDPEAIKAVLPKGAGSQRLVLINRTTPEIAKIVTDLNFSGVSEEIALRRFYPQGEENAQIVGYMSMSNQDSTYRGQSGIESQYNQTLAGESGQVLVLKNAEQHALKQLKELKPAVAGQDIQLTIDSRLQYVLYKELERVGRDQNARWSSGVIVDVHSGDVLAMGSWPSFNTNNLSERTGASERNRPVLDVFEPGSVMKPFTVAAALDSGKYTTNTVIDTSPGHLKIRGGTIKDSGNYGKITLETLIQKSSNVASAKIALALPADSIALMQRKFGFGQKTALNFPAEGSGKVEIPKEEEMARRATLSYGYGQQVTLAQLAQAYAALAAEGKLHPLRLVKNEPIKPPIQVIDPKHAREIVSMMETVTMKGGTGRLAAIDGYRVAGKTGTSRRTSPLGGYAEGEYRAVFVGLAPASNPQFVVAILVEDPRQQFYGGVVAGPVFSRVMRETLRMYNIPMDKSLTD